LPDLDELAQQGVEGERRHIRALDQGLGAVQGFAVVLLPWLWLSTVAVLLGAEINAESEKQPPATPSAVRTSPRDAGAR